jgi:hypothetical protein
MTCKCSVSAASLAERVRLSPLTLWWMAMPASASTRFFVRPAGSVI